MGLVTATETRAQSRDIYLPATRAAWCTTATRHRIGGASRRRDGSHAYVQPTVPAASLRRQLDRPAGRPERLLHCRGLVAGWTVDVFRRDGRTRLAHLAPALSGWHPRTDHLGTERRGWRGHRSRWTLADHVDRNPPQCDLDSRRQGRRALSSEGFAGAPRMSSDGGEVFYLFLRDLSASSTELRSLELATGKVETCCRECRSLTTMCRAMAKRSPLPSPKPTANQISGLRRSTAAPHRVKSSRRRPGLVWRRGRARLPLARRAHQRRGPRPHRRHRPRAADRNRAHPR